MDTFEGLKGLLHCGLLIPQDMDTMVQTLLFYLEVADGWRDSNILKLDGDDSIAITSADGDRTTLFDVRCSVAKKAFDTIPFKLFKVRRLNSSCAIEFEPTRFPRGFQNKHFADLLPALMNFFRVEELDGKLVPVNLGKDSASHQEKEAVEFILRFTDFVWSPKYWSRPSALADLPYAADLVEARIWSVEILSALDCLRLLEKHAGSFDNPIVERLQRIADAHCVAPSDAGVCISISLDEAMYAGSDAAWLIKKDRFMKKKNAKKKK